MRCGEWKRRSKVSKGHHPLPQPEYITTNLLAHLVGKGPQPPLQSSCSIRSHISWSPVPKPGVWAATQQKALAFSAPFYVIKTGGSKGCAGSSFSFFFLPTCCCFSVISPTNFRPIRDRGNKTSPNSIHSGTNAWVQIPITYCLFHILIILLLKIRPILHSYIMLSLRPFKDFVFFFFY